MIEISHSELLSVVFVRQYCPGRTLFWGISFLIHSFYPLTWQTEMGHSFCALCAGGMAIPLATTTARVGTSSGRMAGSWQYDPYGKITYSTGSIAQINPLWYRGYYYDSDTEFYYLQSRYYDANVCRFINADSYASTGQGFLGCNMFAYCRNSPANRTGLGGYADEAAQEKTGQNMENMLAFFGVDSPEGLPEMPDDCMVLLENTWTFLICRTSFVHGTSIVMDADKYCTYSFWGFSVGASGISYDFSVAKGYVYSIENIEDFFGNFYGTAFNGVADIEGGAWASNGVHSEIICGNGFMSASAGFSITRYDTPQKSWKYGKAKINWYKNPHNPFGTRQIVEI